MAFRSLWPAAIVTIRGKILLAFLGLAAITAALGVGAIDSVGASGRLVAATYDRPLLAISEARKAQADFSEMRLLLDQQNTANNDVRRQQLDREQTALANKVADDLDGARDRASSQRASAAATTALNEFNDWEGLRRRNAANPSGVATDTTLPQRAEALLGTIDALSDITIADGLRDREAALAAIARYRMLCIAGTLLVLVIGTLIAMLLARQMIRPIAAASQAASRIAAGELDATIQPVGRDELGRLLSSMAVMRDNIRDMFEREITARRSAQGRLVTAIARLNEGVALVGSDGRVILANAPIAKFFSGQRNAFAEGTLPPVEILAAIAGANGEMRLADSRWLRISRSNVAEGGYVLVAYDITLLKQREAQLQAAKEQAEAADRTKTEFLARMSHELRTPLSAIIGFSEMIANESFGPVGEQRYREFADDILHSGRHLLDIINDILDIAKLQSGTTTLRLQHVMLRSVVDESVRIIRKKAEQAGVQLELGTAGHAPVILGDQLRLRQVLLNLLSNAIKFTPVGGKVSVSVTHGDGSVAITVTDTGIGMAAEDIPRALQPFVQVDSGLARHHDGTGLGLPLSKMFVELHGGHFTIRSEPGRGTTVTIALPAVPAPRQRVAA